MAVTVSGMFGDGNTYFCNSPVVITVEGLEWPTDSSGNPASPFNIVRVEVIYDNKVVGDFPGDTGGQSSISLDISSALKAIWAGYDFSPDLAAAAASSNGTYTRGVRQYSLNVHTEYIASNGTFTTTSHAISGGGACIMGHLTEQERRSINGNVNGNSGLANTVFGNASTKPTGSPEIVGSTSKTSKVSVSGNGTTMTFYATDGGGAPTVLRDSMPYADFLFLNRRGALETCSGRTLESMNIEVDTKQYSRVERPVFQPSRSLMAIGSDGRRSWQMSSGFVTREWAEWWAMEFLGGKRKRWWMLYGGSYVPVIVEPSKKSIPIYDRTKQQMPHVDFTVTLALEG